MGRKIIVVKIWSIVWRIIIAFIIKQHLLTILVMYAERTQRATTSHNIFLPGLLKVPYRDSKKWESAVRLYNPRISLKTVQRLWHTGIHPAPGNGQTEFWHRTVEGCRERHFHPDRIKSQVPCRVPEFHISDSLQGYSYASSLCRHLKNGGCVWHQPCSVLFPYSSP